MEYQERSPLQEIKYKLTAPGGVLRADVDVLLGAGRTREAAERLQMVADQMADSGSLPHREWEELSLILEAHR